MIAVMSPSTTEAQAVSDTKTRTQKKIAVLGCGKMGTILLESFLERKLITPQEAIATVQHGERSQELSRELSGVAVGTDNRAAVAGAEIVLLCVKPQVLGQLLDEIAPALAPTTLVISIAASTTTSFIQQKLGKNIPVVRAMPNTPAMVGAAMTAVCAGPAATAQHLKRRSTCLKAWAARLVVDEKHMDAITALSASGPAFVFVILESLAEAGVKVGLPREMATTLAAQTLYGRPACA